MSIKWLTACGRYSEGNDLRQQLRATRCHSYFGISCYDLTCAGPNFSDHSCTEYTVHGGGAYLASWIRVHWYGVRTMRCKQWLPSRRFDR